MMMKMNGSSKHKAGPAWLINPSSKGQNGRHFTDDIPNAFSWFDWNFIEVLKFFQSSIDNNQAVV